MSPLKAVIHALGRAYIARLTASEAAGQRFHSHNERAIEYRFVFDCLVRVRPITVLDVGTGTTALPSLIASCGTVVTAIDNVRDYWPNGIFNRHWQVEDMDIRHPTPGRQYDLLTCVSMIEHIDDHQAAIRGMLALLNPGGHLVLTTPYNERRAVPNVYVLPGAAYGQNAAYICRSTSRTELDAWLSLGFAILEQEYWRFWTGEVWTQGKPLPLPERSSRDRSHQLTCLLLRKT